MSRTNHSTGRSRPAWTALLLALTVLASACGSDSSGSNDGTGSSEPPTVEPTPAPEATPTPPIADLEILSPSSDGAANVAQPDITWAAVDGAVSYDVEARLGSAGGELAYQRSTGLTSVAVDAPIENGTDVYVTVAAFDGDQNEIGYGESRFRVVIPPADLGRIDLITKTDRASDVYRLGALALGASGAPFLVNKHGEVVWILDDSALGRTGTTLLSQDATLLIQTGAGALEADWYGELVWRVPPPHLVHHEFTDGPDGHRMALTWVAETFDDFDYEGDGIVILDPATDDILWEWNIFDHISPLDHPVPEQENTGFSGLGGDWSHGNGLAWDPDRSLIWLSLRHLDRIVGIDYPSGDIRVTIGQDGLGPDDAVSHQHGPELQEDGQLLVFDNGNTRDPPQSRVVMIDVDEETGSYTETFSWTRDRFFEVATGYATMLPNGNILATAGVSRRMIEIAPDGEVVWEAQVVEARGFLPRADFASADQIPPGVLPFR